MATPVYPVKMMGLGCQKYGQPLAAGWGLETRGQRPGWAAFCHGNSSLTAGRSRCSFLASCGCDAVAIPAICWEGNGIATQYLIGKEANQQRKCAATESVNIFFKKVKVLKFSAAYRLPCPLLACCHTVSPLSRQG